MDQLQPGNVESVEIAPTDYALAYSAVARRMAAIEAILKCRRWPQLFVDVLLPEVEGGMAVIRAVERDKLVVHFR